MRPTPAYHLGGFQDLAVGVPEGLSIELLLDLLVLDLGRLAEAEQVVVQERAHCRRCDLEARSEIFFSSENKLERLSPIFLHFKFTGETRAFLSGAPYR